MEDRLPPDVEYPLGNAYTLIVDGHVRSVLTCSLLYLSSSQLLHRLSSSSLFPLSFSHVASCHCVYPVTSFLTLTEQEKSCDVSHDLVLHLCRVHAADILFEDDGDDLSLPVCILEALHKVGQSMQRDPSKTSE